MDESGVGLELSLSLEDMVGSCGQMERGYGEHAMDGGYYEVDCYSRLTRASIAAGVRECASWRESKEKELEAESEGCSFAPRLESASNSSTTAFMVQRGQ